MPCGSFAPRDFKQLLEPTRGNVGSEIFSRNYLLTHFYFVWKYLSTDADSWIEGIFQPCRHGSPDTVAVCMEATVTHNAGVVALLNITP